MGIVLCHGEQLLQLSGLVATTKTGATGAAATSVTTGGTKGGLILALISASQLRRWAASTVVGIVITGQLIS